MTYYLDISDAPKCQWLIDDFERHIPTTDDIPQADAILVAGWDGTMLRAIRAWHTHGLPFVGYHCGTLGFLMNRRSQPWDIPQDISQFSHIACDMIEVEMKDARGAIYTDFAINDITIWASVLDYMSLQWQIWGESYSTRGTWLVVATSIWSTWYTMNLGAPLTPLESGLWSIAGIGTHPFRYMYTHDGALEISISSRQSISVWCDGYGAVYHDISSLTLTKSQNTAHIARAPDTDFSTRRVLLAEEKLGGSGR